MLDAFHQKDPKLISYLESFRIVELRSLEERPMTPSDYHSGVPENTLQSSGLLPALPGDEYEADTHRFNQFIWAENERLNRLIRNLYLQFQLKHFTERELYGGCPFDS